MSTFVKANRTGNILDNNWLETYNELSESHESVVKILQIENNKIIMEDISSKYPYKLSNIIESSDDKVFENVIKNYFTIISDLLTFGNKKRFFHNDLNLRNFLSTKDGKLILVDPESFVFLDPVNQFEIKYKMLTSYQHLGKLIFKRYKHDR